MSHVLKIKLKIKKLKIEIICYVIFNMLAQNLEKDNINKKA